MMNREFIEATKNRSAVNLSASHESFAWKSTLIESAAFNLRLTRKCHSVADCKALSHRADKIIDSSRRFSDD